jgi:hypothetical protein
MQIGGAISEHGLYGHMIHCFHLPDKGVEGIKELINHDKERSAEHINRVKLILNKLDEQAEIQRTESK